MYFIREGLKGIRRHLLVFIASVGVIAACLVLTGSFGLLAVNLEYNLEHMVDENEFVAYLDDSAGEEQLSDLEDSLRAIPHVTECTYISSEEAMASYLERMGGSSEYYSDLPEDLLPARYSVQVDDTEALKEASDAAAELEGVSHVSVSLTIAEGFASTKKTCIAITLFLLVIFLLVSLFIITNSLRLALRGREQEIAVMKMVGATNAFVRAPFLIEGMILGLLSGAAGFLLEWGFYTVLQQIMDSYRFTELFYLIRFERLRLLLLAAYLGAGLLVGTFGSMVAIRRLLKV